MERNNFTRFTCFTVQDTGRCPGAFHVGCQDDPHETTKDPETTDPETTDPDTTDPDSGSTTLAVNWKSTAFAFLLAVAQI